jgi:hypothetical protein
MRFFGLASNLEKILAASGNFESTIYLSVRQALASEWNQRQAWLKALMLEKR